MQQMITIRKVRPEDGDAVRKLINGIMDEEFAEVRSQYAYQDLDDPTTRYGGPRDTFFVAEKDGLIIGTVAIKEDSDDTALLRRVFVRKEDRGHGYGEQLLSKAVEFCFENKYKNIIFRGTAKMQRALKLCLRNGFEQADVADLADRQLIKLSRNLAASDGPKA